MAIPSFLRPILATCFSKPFCLRTARRVEWVGFLCPWWRMIGWGWARWVLAVGDGGGGDLLPDWEVALVLVEEDEEHEVEDLWVEAKLEAREAEAVNGWVGL